MSQNQNSIYFNHLALHVNDLNKSAEFYIKVMQLDTVPEPFHDGNHVWLRIGPKSTLHLIGKGPVLADQDIHTHLCFTVPSLENFIKLLEQKKINYGNFGGQSKAITTRPDGVKQIYLKDPDGYWIEVNDDKN